MAPKLHYEYEYEYEYLHIFSHAFDFVLIAGDLTCLSMRSRHLHIIYGILHTSLDPHEAVRHLRHISTVES